MNNSLVHHSSIERKLSRQPTVAELGGAYGTSLIAQSYENYVATLLCSKSGFEVLHDAVYNKVLYGWHEKLHTHPSPLLGYCVYPCRA